MALAKRVLNRGTLAVGSSTLIATATVLVICCLWLLSVKHGDEGGLALATVITGFIAATIAVLPAAIMAALMASRSIKSREPPYHCLPIRMRDPFKGMAAAAFPLSIVPCALGLSLPSEYAECSSDQTVWHLGFPCRLLKVTWGLCLIMMVLTLTVILPLRSAVGASTILPTKTVVERESTSSLEKPPAPLYGHINPSGPPTREQQRWIQRHNSLSSQKAIYPYAFEPRRSVSNFGSGGYHAFPRATNSLRSYSFSESQPNLPSTARAYSFSTVSRPTTSRSSSTGSPPMTAFSSSTGSVHSRRYRLDLSPDCPSIPESPKQQSLSKTSSKDAAPERPKPANEVPALPAPAWCPPLLHAPLSSDPAIRALTGSTSRISLQQRQSRLQQLTGTSLTLSRQTTAGTSLLDFSRPSTAPSLSSNARSRSGASVSPSPNPNPKRPRTQAFVSALGTGLPASPRPIVLPVTPPLPPLPPTPMDDHPPPLPRRATGHLLVPRAPSSLSSSSSSAGGSTIRHLRKPSPLRVRKQRGGEVVQRERGRERNLAPRESSSARMESLQAIEAEQRPCERGREIIKAQKPQARTPKGRKTTAAAATAAQAAVAALRQSVAVAAVAVSGDAGGGAVIRNIHEERGRERIARGGGCVDSPTLGAPDKGKREMGPGAGC